MAYTNPLDPRARESRRKHYYANKEQYQERNRKAKEEKAAYIREYKTSRGCMDCGGKFPSFVLELDHLDSSQKLYTPATLANLGSWNKLHAELAKCEVVCANCHRIRTAKRGGWRE